MVFCVKAALLWSACPALALVVGCGSAHSSAAGGTDGGSTNDGSSAAPPPADDGSAGPTPPEEGGVAIPPGSVTFTIDMTKGPARQYQPPATPQKVSPYVYGINGFGSYVKQATQWGLIRQGGDAYTSWNWASNYSNSGADYCFWQGEEGSGDVAGAILEGGDSLPNAQAKGEAFLVTVPILEHVSSEVSNNTGINNLCPQTASNCNGGTASSTAVNSGGLDFASTDATSAAFVANNATKPGATYCTCPGPACGAGCTVAQTGPVYADELANFLHVNYGGASAPQIFLMLDNEPNYWGSTHPELWPYTGTLPCETATVLFDDVVTRDESFATGIKTAWPDAKVVGPVVAQDGVIYAHSYSDTHLPTEFADYYLQQMAAASTTFGKPLLDVFDVHYYNSGSTDPTQCVQSPRMFWDPAYTSLSDSATDAIDFGWSGPSNYFDTAWYPRKVIPRLLGKIATAYPIGGTAAPGLSFSEYNSGCETVIAGGVAEADNLGIFGREGVYAATAWPLDGSATTNYLVAAFDAYRNYDGSGTVVGDTAVSALTSNAEGTSVYAFAHSTEASAVDLVILNKASAATTVSIVIDHAPALSKTIAYNLVDGKPAVVAATGAAPTVTCAGGTCALAYAMPAMSVTTLAIR